MAIEGENAQTSRARLLAAGRSLFARYGYEQTSTASIARSAATSESQLVRYFGGKSGLLEAIFNDAWSALATAVSVEAEHAASGRDAILAILRLFVETFARDRDLAFLFLLEGRRVRGTELVISEGFLAFNAFLVDLATKGQQDGSLVADIPPQVLVSGMLGSAEGMVRDSLIARQLRQDEPFDGATVNRVFEAMAAGLAPAK